MSSLGMITTTLATGLSKALYEDEQTFEQQGGYDISAGIYGVNVSNWLRKVAIEFDELGRTTNDNSEANRSTKA